jgi:hypothetical protein
MSFRIAQISDTHLSAAKPFFVENFRALAHWLRASAPDLVLNSGDIALDGPAREDDLAAARALHDEIGLAVRYIPGNHDVGDNRDVPELHGHPPVDAATCARYRQYFGEDWWSLDVPGWRIVAVNAHLVGSGLPDAAAQDDFIAGQVAGVAGRALALFIHKPLFDVAPDEDEVGGRFLNPVARHGLLRLLEGAPLSVVASGHVHQYRRTEHAGVSAVWAPSGAFVLPDAFQPVYGLKQVGYVEHRFHPDGTHDCGFVQPAGMATLSIADFEDAYGALPPLAAPADGGS